MSRADVASATARAGARSTRVPRSLDPTRWRGRSIAQLLRSALPVRAAPNEHPRAIAPRGRWLVPFALSGLLSILGAALLHYTFEERDRLVSTASADLEFLASVVADDLDNHSGTPGAAPGVLLRRLHPAQALSRGQRIVVSDAKGEIVAALPARAGAGGGIAEQLGAAQPLSVFAEKAGVMRLTLSDGEDVLATVRTLHAPLGQMVVLHPIDHVLVGWRSTYLRMVTAFGLIALILAALASAYVRQASRTRQVNSVCRAMRDRFEMVLARGRCGLWDWDLAAGTIEWSKSMFELVGMPPRSQTLAFAEVDALIHPGDGGLAAIAREISASETPVEHVFRMRSAGTGEWIWLRAKVELVKEPGGGTHVIGIALDITDTMALEERTARADMRLRDAIETVSEAFVVWDADNRLVMCNSKFQRFHNLPPDAVAVGTPYAAVMERGTAPLIHSQVSLGAQQPLGARTFEAQLGDGRWLQINERRTKDGGYVSVGTDITTLKRHEEQLLESERRLMATVIDLKKSRQKLEAQTQELAELAEKYLEQKAEAETASRAKSDFLANMGHELRTPLNAILGFSEIMMLEAYGKLGSPQYLDYSTHIHTSGHHLLAMIADILEMARLDAGRVRLEKADFVLADAMTAAVGSVATAAATSGLSITVEGDETCRVHADRNAIERILTICLNNSVKYTPASGCISIRCRDHGSHLDLCVEDTGVGMPPDAVVRLGRPFEQGCKTLKNGIRGSGLGLAIARSLVELHGGTMRITSAEGAGTAVQLRFPQRAKPAQPQGMATLPARLVAARAPGAIRSVAKRARAAQAG